MTESDAVCIKRLQASGTKSVPNFPNVSEASQVSVRELPEARRVSAALATTMLRRSRSVINATSAPQPPSRAAPNGRPGAGRGSRSDAGVARGGRGRANGGDRAPAPDRPAAGPRSRVTAQKQSIEQPSSDVVCKPGSVEEDGAVAQCGAAAPEEHPAGGGVGPETASAEELAAAVTMGDTPACSDSKVEDNGDDDFPEASDMEYDSGSEGVSERCSDTIETEAGMASTWPCQLSTVMTLLHTIACSRWYRTRHSSALVVHARRAAVLCAVRILCWLPACCLCSGGA